eukprot:955578-Prorocentrum_minimum.AAC.1
MDTRRDGGGEPVPSEGEPTRAADAFAGEQAGEHPAEGAREAHEPVEASPAGRRPGVLGHHCHVGAFVHPADAARA